MEEINVFLGQSFSHMAGSEEKANEIVENYKSKFEVKKSLVQKKVKKGVEYWVVKVDVTFVSEKDAYDQNFGE